MNHAIEVFTLFDCTPTNVRSYRKNPNLSEETWHYQRNQQRNVETLMQCLSLRCQPLNITEPTKNNGVWNREIQAVWHFCFETDRDLIFALDDDPLGFLKQDCHGVPMLIGLEESNRELFLTPYLVTLGDSCNTLFKLLNDK